MGGGPKVGLRRRVTAWCGALAALGAALSVPGSAHAALDDAQTPAEQPQRVDSILVVTKTAEASSAVIRAADRQLGTDADVTDATPVVENFTKLELDSDVDVADASDVAEALAQRDDVVTAVPNIRMYTAAQPPVNVNDPAFGRQRNLWDKRTSPVGGYSIKAPSLWRKTQGEDGPVVAVLDTGILASHPDLAGKLVTGYDFISDVENARDGNGRDPDPHDEGDWTTAGLCDTKTKATDSSWHGTFVAGQIGAVANNGTAIAGVAPGARVQPVRVLGPCGGEFADIVAAMEWASGGTVGGVPANPTPAAVINMSLASPQLSASERQLACTTYNIVADVARDNGAIVVAAAGNERGNANNVVPAGCSGIISVGATSVNGFGASYSNIGSSVDLSAPGGDSRVDPASDPMDSDWIWSLSNLGKTGPGEMAVGGQQGTSMAAPVVSGAAALMYSLGMTTPSQMTQAIYAAVTPFRGYSSAYARKKVAGKTLDLNCRATGRAWCGRGILDLSRVETPLSPPTIQGSVIVGEPLTVNIGSWVSKPTPTYQWRVNGTLKSTAAVYWPTLNDVGQSITVSVRPSTSAFSTQVSTSADVTVPDAPDVRLSLSTTKPKWGSAVAATVTVPGAAGGTVRLRDDAGRIVATAPVVAGRATARIAAKKMAPGTHRVRAAYVTDGTTPSGSSPRVKVAVTQLSAAVSLKAPTKVAKGKRAKIRVTVSDRPNVLAHPRGKVRVYDGSKVLVTKTLGATARGKITITLPKLRKGTHKIKVRYLGDQYIAPAQSTVRRIKAQ